ncbi:MAG: peptide deformylase [Candidatus Omnitrophica bacterium]|nr:peptide deformylase [Candidatus Omnitrophota bacterium]
MKETKLKIRVYGDQCLRSKAKPVKAITDYHKKLLVQMSRIMYESSGIGLASSQVGIEEALIVVDAGCGLYKLINPKIIVREGAQVIDEGCLSVPGISIKVTRAQKITLEAQDEQGRSIVLHAEDLLACVFQHEIDHLEGKLIVDYAEDKEEIQKKLKGLRVV